MSSPFPGMDPFLEAPAYWPDFHSTFINYWREALADVLPTGYEASLGERVYLIEHDPEEQELGDPDFASAHSKFSSTLSSASGGVATVEPVTIPVKLLQGPRESFIEIRHHADQTLVAALELLSLATREQPGRTQYLNKRRSLLFQEVHLIELDLLLGGRRLPFMKPLPSGDYYYTVARAGNRPDCQVYSWSLPHPLPRVPVPLRLPDPDLLIDLAAVFTTAYDRGRFRRRLNYGGEVQAALSEEQKRWVGEVVKAGNNSN